MRLTDGFRPDPGPLQAALDMMEALVAGSRDPVLAATRRSFLLKLGLHARGPKASLQDLGPEALVQLTAEALEAVRFMQARRRRADARPMGLATQALAASV